MTITIVVVVCVLVLILAFLFPRLSRHPERGGRKVAGATRVTSRAPGKLGAWLSKPFRTSQRAISRSGSSGRKGRRKLPF